MVGTCQQNKLTSLSWGVSTGAVVALTWSTVLVNVMLNRFPLDRRDEVDDEFAKQQSFGVHVIV